MKKVITYGTFDLLHYGHIKLLERAKELGDYLIVGITSDDFDKQRGKINVQQTLMERVKAVKNTGLADEIIIEEYEGQKIDDICNYGIDVFTVGSDWTGKFDYLKEYCQVIYLDRTEGISSTEIRSNKRKIRFGLVGNIENLEKIKNEAQYVNGIEVVGIYSEQNVNLQSKDDNILRTDSYEDLLKNVDAVYLISKPSLHYSQIKQALVLGKHVLCESPLAISQKQCRELIDLAEEKKCILMEGLKTAYSTAYTRLLLLLKGGVIGKIVSVDATCTSLKDYEKVDNDYLNNTWNSICAWGPTAMLPIFQILGINYLAKNAYSLFIDNEKKYDLFTKINFNYGNAVASIKVGKGVKSEGELVVTGTKGYVYVPAPWWKTDYFEIRYENALNNKRYFYKLDGEGIRFELVAFCRAIELHLNDNRIKREISLKFSEVIEDVENHKDLFEIN